MPGSRLGSRCSLGRCLSITHGNVVPVPWLPQNSPSVVTACGALPHLATHTRLSSHTAFHSKVCNRHARSLPGNQAVSLSSATGLPPQQGIRYLNNHTGEMCTSAPASAPPKLFSTSHRTPSPASCVFPGCEEVSAGPGPGHWDNRDFANSPRGTAAASCKVLFRDVTTIPVTPATHTEQQKAARFPPGLPAGAGSTEVLYCILAPQEWAGQQLTHRCHPGRKVRAPACC